MGQLIYLEYKSHIQFKVSGGRAYKPLILQQTKKKTKQNKKDKIRYHIGRFTLQ